MRPPEATRVEVRSECGMPLRFYQFWATVAFGGFRGRGILVSLARRRGPAWFAVLSVGHRSAPSSRRHPFGAGQISTIAELTPAGVSPAAAAYPPRVPTR